MRNIKILALLVKESDCIFVSKSYLNHYEFICGPNIVMHFESCERERHTPLVQRLFLMRPTAICNSTLKPVQQLLQEWINNLFIYHRRQHTFYYPTTQIQGNRSKYVISTLHWHQFKATLWKHKSTRSQLRSRFHFT